MNTNQGFAIGAIVLVGLIVRSLGPGPAEVHESTHSPEETAAHAKTASESDAIGPWIASCNYWAAMSPFAANVEGPSHLAPIEIQEKQQNVDLRVSTVSEEDELGCPNHFPEKWGFPHDAHKISVKAIIATVPDPVHTHLAITFDRIVAALLRAAQANGYLSSYYWVPWTRQPSIEDRAADTADSEELGHDPIRERQPGLLVLKSKDDPRNVLFVFLVGESPSEGINGFQIQNAFQYERELQTLLKDQYGDSGREGQTSIVGPMYSGSAASMHSAIETEASQTTDPGRTFEVSGLTSTAAATDILKSKLATGSAKINYRSFDEAGDFTECKFFQALQDSGYDLGRTAILTETSTLFAATYVGPAKDKACDFPILQIPFPREISLLRNAQEESGIARINPFGGANVPRRFLHLTLRDNSPADSVPQFSRENTPLSQEAQLMEIGRQLHRLRIQYVAIVASNPLDQIFLAQFLHTSVPDARLFAYGGDFLMEREVDNVPFIGTITVSPYSLIGMTTAAVFPDAESVGYYNAFSSELWRVPEHPKDTVALNNEIRSHLQGYSLVSVPPDGVISGDQQWQPQWQPLLWATTIGIDGYYPLAILNPCSSNRAENTPGLNVHGFTQSSCGNDPSNRRVWVSLQALPSQQLRPLFPSLLWEVLCFLVGALCLAHTVALLIADYWSPITRDLLIDGNDQPRRRAMYLNIAMAMLFSMACVSALPALLFSVVTLVWQARVVAGFTLAAGLLTCIVSCVKVLPLSWPVRIGDRSPGTHRLQRLDQIITENIYFLVNICAFATGIAIPWAWWMMCVNNDGQEYRGLFFSYRCINPGSGVSPLVPVVLLLLAWYIWANCQTKRLRFSEAERPRLPSASEDSDDNLFFITDQELSGLKPHGRYALFRNICCLFITRESLRHAIGRGRGAKAGLDLALLGLYLAGLILFSLFDPIRSLNHFLWANKYIADPFEILMGLLFFPLLMVSLAGWLRILLIWKALRNGLLVKLENLPIRLAFSRLRGFGWMGMLRQSGIEEKWRDIARSVESIQYVKHEDDIKKALEPDDWEELAQMDARLTGTLCEIRERIATHGASSNESQPDFALANRMERGLSAVCGLLLTKLLIPYWQHERVGLVDGVEVEELPMKARRWHLESSIPNLPVRLQASPEPADPSGLIAAQEFVALRYVALIRAVLANIRSLMAFVSIAFVLCIVAWHSYPFQPRQQVDWLSTGLMVVLGTGIVWVFAEMYRNPILSRITDTEPNELGWEFYVRILAFGAIPVLTWVAYQFPDVGSIVFKVFQPAADVMK